MIIQDLLLSAGIDRGEAATLLGHVLEVDRTWLYAHSEQITSNASAERFEKLVQARKAGEPLAYLLGYRDFWSLRLSVNPNVLIPRRETEHLVEWAIECIDAGAQRILDLGTGSGAIALACKAERPATEVWAVDSSPEALTCAAANGQSLGLDVEWVLSDWFAALPKEKWDLLISNPPYVAAGDEHLAHGDLRAEPSCALIGGPTGFECIERIVEAAPDFLSNGGWLLLEHGFDQAPTVSAMMSSTGFDGVGTRQDWSGQARLTGGQWWI